MNLQPIIQQVNGKPVHFYSLQQLEEIIPPEKRLPSQVGSNLELEQDYHNKKKPSSNND